jgi:hypothetical protein
MGKPMKGFNERLRANPDSFDDEDSRPGPSKYPAASAEKATPDHIRKRLAGKKPIRRAAE